MTPRLPRWPFVVLGAMTVLTFGGPVAIGIALRGGTSPIWPPDRPLEWAVLVGVFGTFFALMMVCLSRVVVDRRAMARAAARAAREPRAKP